jgi:hypothetical protein
MQPCMVQNGPLLPHVPLLGENPHPNQATTESGGLHDGLMCSLLLGSAQSLAPVTVRGEISCTRSALLSEFFRETSLTDFARPLTLPELCSSNQRTRLDVRKVHTSSAARVVAPAVCARVATQVHSCCTQLTSGNMVCMWVSWYLLV